MPRVQCPVDSCDGYMWKDWADKPGGVTELEFRQFGYHYVCRVCGVQRTRHEMGE